MTKIKSLKWDDLVLHEDDHYALINKPAGLSTLDDRSSDVSVLSLARQVMPDSTPCHRLDKETSGVLILAKDEDAYRYMAGQLENRQVKKVYHAVVDGLQNFDDFSAEEPLYSGSNKTRVDRSGKESLTLIQTLEVFKKHTLLKCFPVTGRMHQIRVHLSFHGAPIVADTTYGGRQPFLSELKKNYNLGKYKEERPMIGRLALHAHSIAFSRPDNGQTVEIIAPYPKDFAVLVKQLRKFS